jgi:nanoRNase/pAp phosphatase (c-di-AMP/oligoRNAs hydrolase)
LDRIWHKLAVSKTARSRSPQTERLTKGAGKVQSPKNNSQLHPVLTVTQLTNQLRDTLENAFQQVYVVGEVSNAKVYPSGHWYFSIKDK